ncbi:hypothetical protein M231_01971 [Tremella mesenterica]|uniref:Amine oxidase domain-containing protein n=1 Tax=Tremella mesenterica TaxID=5217 RepID=A0A4Q1BRX4_TREME|nr:hypothetical protein M231_01971 [Tremella mesenterica]
MKVAIVGSGVAGLSALWMLNEYSEHEVHIFDKEDWAGGHAHTVDYQSERFASCDTVQGLFVVRRGLTNYQMSMNPVSYPNLYRFLRAKGIETVNVPNSLTVSHNMGEFEWASGGLLALFCQPKNIFKKRIYRMLLDVWRFNHLALDLLRDPSTAIGITVGQYLKDNGYSEEFKRDYLLPMTGSIWATPTDKVFEAFPILTLVKYMHNHLILHMREEPEWLTIKGGSANWVKVVIDSVPQNRVHLKTAVSAVQPLKNGDGVVITTAEGKEKFDHVILATHSQVSLELLRRGGGASEDEERLLSPCEWTDNVNVVHWDDRVCCPFGQAFASLTAYAESVAWHYLSVHNNQDYSKTNREKPPHLDTNGVCTTINLNALHNLPVSKHGLCLTTLNPHFPVDPKKILSVWKLDHPVMSQSLMEAQKHLHLIQNKRGISFAGAWTGYGFHEDGFRSGMQVAEALGVKGPWEVMSPNRDIPDPNSRERMARKIATWIGKRRLRKMASSRVSGISSSQSSIGSSVPEKI